MDNLRGRLIIVRGGGDIATGTIARLHRCGFRVLALEAARPSAIRRNVAFSEAVYEGRAVVEGIECVLARNLAEAQERLARGGVTMLVDERAEAVAALSPMAVVDAILAKRNLGTTRDMCSITVALGPGFVAGEDVDAVVETQRGHNLGRVIYAGSAAPNTGVPGVIAGYAAERVIHSPAAGVLRCEAALADAVRKGQRIARIETAAGDVPVYATIDGLLRGLLREGYPVTRGFKIADIDPRISERQNCFTISDKASAIAGGVLEAILSLRLRGCAP